MLIELPLYYCDNQSGIVEQSAATFLIKNIESIVRNDTDTTCDLNTVSGDCFRVNLPYEKMIHFWHDSLETLGGVYVARLKETTINTELVGCGKADCKNLN
jgi:hypothetical protein